MTLLQRQYTQKNEKPLYLGEPFLHVAHQPSLCQNGGH